MLFCVFRKERRGSASSSKPFAPKLSTIDFKETCPRFLDCSPDGPWESSEIILVAETSAIRSLVDVQWYSRTTWIWMCWLSGVDLEAQEGRLEVTCWSYGT